MVPGQAAKRQYGVTCTDAQKRRDLLEEFIFWYFSSFLLQLLKVCHGRNPYVIMQTDDNTSETTFYVTETAVFRNQVLYFRHDDWQTLCAPLIDRLTSGTFEKMSQVMPPLSPSLSLTLTMFLPSFYQSEAEEILRQRKLGFSFIRLLPKETGVRPIVNLRRRKSTQVVCSSGASRMI